MTEYARPLFHAEQEALNNHTAVTEQYLSSLTQIVGQAFPMLQEQLQRLTQANNQSRQAINVQYNVNRLQGHGAAFTRAYQNADALGRQELLNQLPQSVETPYDAAALEKELRYALLKDGKFLPSIPTRGPLMDLQNRLSDGTSKLTPDDDGLWEQPENRGHTLISVYRLSPASAAHNRMLAITLTQDGKLSVDFKILVPGEGAWIDDTELRYFTGLDLDEAIKDKRRMGVDYHARREHLSELREQVGDSTTEGLSLGDQIEELTARRATPADITPVLEVSLVNEDESTDSSSD